MSDCGEWIAATLQNSIYSPSDVVGGLLMQSHLPSNVRKQRLRLPYAGTDTATSNEFAYYFFFSTTLALATVQNNLLVAR